ncbi:MULTISPECIES: glycosyltransferase family 9 protein [unclassified Helicobacter]|uniref:glycosyltransferase family 9 protein n=1 Tax=unclassified Helicobacter TaxID=2593540 RepID=UPI000CF08C92|nr:MULTISPECIES: glycosyltransferase family 9 protein [unclassified Helicobacter]
MRVFLGEKTTQKNFLFLSQKLQHHTLTYFTTHQKILSFCPSCKLIQNANLNDFQLVYMPNKAEKRIAREKNILFYTYRHQNIFKSILKQIRNALFSLVDFLAKKKPQYKHNLVVVKPDAIGDYILFRNFIKLLYQEYGKITLIANQTNQNLIETFDKNYLLNYILINRKKFLTNPLYRFKIIRILSHNSYKILINPLYSRDAISEQIVRNIQAETKVTSTGDTSNLTLKEKNIYDQNYTKILPSSSNIMFEFNRNLEFFQNLFQKEIDIEYGLELKDTSSPFDIPKPYFVFFIGASINYRKWSSSNFIEVGKFILSKQYNIVICGGKEDQQSANLIATALSNSNQQIINLCGKTTLNALVQVIYNSSCLLSNETSCAHIAQAIRHNKVFVMSNGNHLHRFTPYPKNLGGKYYGIYHPVIQKNFDMYILTSNLLYGQDKLDINMITPKDVIEVIDSHL